MEITKDLVKHLATLARLNLSESDLEARTAELGDILKLVEQLKEIDTNDVVETSQVTGLTNVTQSDLVELCEIEKELLTASPQEIKQNMICIPRVVK